MPQVIITIDAQGQATVEAKNVTGSGCKKLTADIERALGQTSADQNKPEFFQQANNQQTRKVSQ